MNNEGRAKTLSGYAGRAKGNEFVGVGRGEHLLYVNHVPHFTVRHCPRQDPEEVWYTEWETQIILYGWNLRFHYEALKANAPEALSVSKGPYDPTSNAPYIQRIEERIRL